MLFSYSCPVTGNPVTKGENPGQREPQRETFEERPFVEKEPERVETPQNSVPNREYQNERPFNDYNNNQNESHPKFYTVEEKTENFYGDIAINTSDEKEYGELDDYKANEEVKFENKPELAKVKKVVKRSKYVKPPLSILKKSGTATYFGDDSTEYQKMNIPKESVEFVWKGVKRAYWSLPIYNLPVCKFKQQEKRQTFSK